MLNAIHSSALRTDAGHFYHAMGGLSPNDMDKTTTTAQLLLPCLARLLWLGRLLSAPNPLPVACILYD